MHTSVACAHGVGIAIHGNLVAGGGLQGHLYLHSILFFGDADDLLEERRVGTGRKLARVIGQPFSRVKDALHLLLGVIVVGIQVEGHAAIEIGGGFQPALNRLERVKGVGIENAAIVEPAQLRAVSFWIA